MNTPTRSAQQLIETHPDGIKPFPRIVLDILDVLDDDEASTQKLVDHLHRDPVLSGQVLGQANLSASKLPGQRPVLDVNAAVAMLGYSRIRTLVSTLAVKDALNAPSAGIQTDHFWGHSVDVAAAAKVIAEHAGLKPDLAYVAGLLHDIGAFWIARNLPAPFSRVSQLMHDSHHDILETERGLIGADHTQIGAALCQSWHLPNEIRLSVAGHHSPDEKTATPYVMAVHLAEMSCNALNLGHRSRNVVSHLSEQTLPALGLAWGQIPDLLGEIEARARYIRAFTGLTSHSENA